MSRKPKYEIATLEIGDKFKLKTTPETVQKDVHCLRSAISQHKRLYNRGELTFDISTTKDGNTILCQRVS